MSQSNPERARVSQRELDSGSQIPCSQLIMHDSESEIGSQSATIRGRATWVSRSIFKLDVACRCPLPMSIFKLNVAYGG